MACQELGRNFIGFELNEKYWKIANDRLKGLSQKDRKLQEAGQLSMFDELE